jgi:hypothetical protein
MKIITCISCDVEFDLHSPQKKKAGGRMNECIDCANEPAIKYVGLQAADGKQSQATILKFNNELDKQKYIAFWQNNSGLHKGKSCQLGRHLSTTPNIKFETLVAHNPTNHKGKS